MLRLRNTHANFQFYDSLPTVFLGVYSEGNIAEIAYFFFLPNKITTGTRIST